MLRLFQIYPNVRPLDSLTWSGGFLSLSPSPSKRLQEIRSNVPMGRLDEIQVNAAKAEWIGFGGVGYPVETELRTRAFVADLWTSL